MEQATRIQTSFINGVERKALIWIAKQQPHWITSDMLTAVGVVGALFVAVGFALSSLDVRWLWLSSLGMLINWYGDSLDGTLARVRNCQRPIYGYYVDHTVDCINEGLMFVGAGLSPFVRLDIALLAYALYLVLTITVSINAHLKGEFRLTYAKLGPTEFRMLVIIVNTFLILLPKLAAYSCTISILGISATLHVLDLIALVVIVGMANIYIITLVSDARKYARIDPKKHWHHKA